MGLGDELMAAGEAQRLSVLKKVTRLLFLMGQEVGLDGT